MHRLAKITDDSFGAQPASLVLIGISPLAMQHLVTLHRHAPAANPVVTIPRMYVVEIRHAKTPEPT
ncbi:MAG TPA: hypothetical protein VEU96_26190 [Bryobacteraceae bacterium]|nr:hypothetical protein [Bryobacteraceae bacterium]